MTFEQPTSTKAFCPRSGWSSWRNCSFNSSTLPGSDQADFDAMKTQLTTEFQYLAAVRQLQTNIRQVYQDQQSNVGLELQQARIKSRPARKFL